MWTLLFILFGFWLIGFSFKIAGGLIHILLVIAVIVFVYQLFIKTMLRD
ncbi:MAG TPA: lmo0937 family membrane protein [Bacillota bacterium]|nr:lmo0937 family membrane protein [Bacillota bacterium]